MLDKKDTPAHVIPTGAKPDIVNPLPTGNPLTPNKLSETIKNFFFLFELLYFLYNIHYLF